MCKAKSFICVKGETEPRWSPKPDSHSQIIKDLGFVEGPLHSRNLVKIDYFPENEDWFAPSDQWTFVVDEEGTLPAWFEEDRQLWEDRIKEVTERKILTRIRKGHFPGDLHISKDTKAPKLESVGGNLYIDSNVELTVPKLESVGGDLCISSNTELPKLESVGGYLCLHYNAKLKAPKLKSVDGYLCLHYNAELKAPKLKKDKQND